MKARIENGVDSKEIGKNQAALEAHRGKGSAMRTLDQLLAYLRPPDLLQLFIMELAEGSGKHYETFDGGGGRK